MILELELTSNPHYAKHKRATQILRRIGSYVEGCVVADDGRTASAYIPGHVPVFVSDKIDIYESDPVTLNFVDNLSRELEDARLGLELVAH